MAEEELVLNTERKRRHVVIDGARLSMEDPDDLPYGRSIEISNLLEIVSKPKEITPEAGDQVSIALNRLMKSILPEIGDELLKKLTDAHKLSILTAFLKAPRKQPVPVEPERAVAG